MKHQRRLYKFLVTFLLGSAPSPALLGAFALGLIVVGIFADLLYDLLAAPREAVPHAWLPLAACLLLTLLAYVLYLIDRRTARTIGVDVNEAETPGTHAGLIWLLGPGSFGHLLTALNHHRQGGGATHCWLIMQDVAEVRDAFTRLSQKLIEDEMPTQLHPYYINEPDVEATYQAVRHVLERLISEVGLKEGQAITDITGGTKPMTAGMMLAALATSCDLEYVSSRRDEEGQAIERTAHVVKIDLGFYVKRQREQA